MPFIVERLNTLREVHNVLLVTNDHVKTLTELADNTITVSAVDRSTVTVNEMTAVERELTMHAVASGVDFDHGVNDVSSSVRSFVLSLRNSLAFLG